MIVDVLRNDLGRVCRPGSVRVPRLCRLERTAAVQHLVSTVTGVLAPDRDAFDLLAASFPGGSITGAPEDPRDGDPRGPRARPTRSVHGRHRLDRAGRGDADEHRHPHVRGRRAAADAPRRRRHHLEERPGRRVGRDGRPRRAARSARSAGSRRRDERTGRGRRAAPRPGTSGSTAASCRRTGRTLSVFDRGFQLGDGVFETLRVRGGHPTELAEHVARLHRSAAGLDIALPDGPRRRAERRDRRAARGRRPRRPDRRRVGPDHGLARSVPRSRPPAAGRGRRADHRHPGVAGRRRRPADHLERGLHLVASAVRRDPANPLVTLKTTSRADYVYARLEARRAGADDALFLTIDGHLSEGTTANIFLVRRRRSSRRRRSTARSCRARPGRGCWHGAARVGLRPVEGRLARPTSPRPTRRSCRRQRRRGPAGHPVRGCSDRRRTARTVDAAGAGGSRGDDPRRRGRRVKRDELIVATRAARRGGRPAPAPTRR